MNKYIYKGPIKNSMPWSKQIGLEQHMQYLKQKLGVTWRISIRKIITWLQEQGYHYLEK